MDVPLDAEVRCVDGPGGRTTTIILNPVSQKITHVVVKEGGVEYMVPLELVSKSDPNGIGLSCTQEELSGLDRFVDIQFYGKEEIQVQYDLLLATSDADVNWWPYYPLDSAYAEQVGLSEQIPHDELAIHRGAQVEASDGHIGRVDQFIINPENNHITHLVLHHGFLWRQKDATVPISQIDRIEEDTVYLKLDKEQVRDLPAVPRRRKENG